MPDKPPTVIVKAARWRYVFWTVLIGGILLFVVCSVTRGS